MDSRIDIIKGIHPGKVIERDLKKKGLTQRGLAERTGIPYQTINAIITGRRDLTTGQALKLEETLGYEEGFLSILQSFYDIKLYKEKQLSDLYPGHPQIRKIIFWDADFGKINWGKNKSAIIKRVLERGSKEEIDEIIRFYNLSPTELSQYKPSPFFRTTGLDRNSNG
jgi:addiction module HigA family antidote